jgi:hypothetical protein
MAESKTRQAKPPEAPPPADAPPADQPPAPAEPVKADPDPAPAAEAEPDESAGITTADTAALRGVSMGSTPARPRRILISQGAMDDLVRLGKVTDPGTGYELRRDPDGGEITVWDRRTKQQVDIPTS